MTPDAITDLRDAMALLAQAPLDSWLAAVQAYYELALVRWGLLLWVVSRY